MDNTTKSLSHIGFYSEYGFDDFNYLLSKVMPTPEIYKEIPLKQVLGRWQYGVKSFETKEELKNFIDTMKLK